MKTYVFFQWFYLMLAMLMKSKDTNEDMLVQEKQWDNGWTFCEDKVYKIKNQN